LKLEEKTDEFENMKDKKSTVDVLMEQIVHKKEGFASSKKVRWERVY
jgi:hypothetical protein